MDTLELTNFKAFLSPISIKFEQKNALIYGENGSGKSSIYDAIKLWFHTQKIYDKDLDKNLTDPNDIRNAQRDILDSYNHQKNKAVRFTMSLNGVLYSSTSSLTGYESFMIERSDLDITDNINIVNVLSKSLIGISNPQRFITENKLVLEELINATIQKDFHEPNIEISFQASGNDWFLKIKDIKRNIERVNELSKYFNEGKLHLIMLLILFSSIQLNGSIATKKILILDDITTSLDAANRVLLIKYIYEYLKSYQIIISTHSVSFFNQMYHAFHIVWGENDKWKLFHIIENDGDSNVWEENSMITSQELRKQYQNSLRSRTTPMPSSIPNDIRKRFEFLVQEISNLMCIGGIAESGRLLTALNNKKNLYFRYDTVNKRRLNIYDMVEEIEYELSQASSSPLKTSLENILTQYKKMTELQSLHNTLQLLMIYQKVAMHAGSHHTGALTPTTSSEIDCCILLLQELESLMGKLIHRDTYSI